MFADQSGLTQHRRRHWKSANLQPAAADFPEDADINMEGDSPDSTDHAHIKYHPIMDGSYLNRLNCGIEFALTFNLD